MNPNTEKPNDIGLDVIQKEVKRLQGRATTLQSKAIARTDANVEKTGSVVDRIKISTQSIERIMIEELRPIMNETRNLVRESRWKMDVYAKATRSDIQTDEIGTWEPEMGVDPTFRIVIGGKLGGRGTCWDVRDPGELMDSMWEVIRRIGINKPGLGKKLYGPFGLRSEVALALFSEGVEAVTQVVGERYANARYRQYVECDPTTGDMILKLHWLPMCKTPIHYDLFRNTDISNS